jgi:hypothetical protein
MCGWTLAAHRLRRVTHCPPPSPLPSLVFNSILIHITTMVRVEGGIDRAKSRTPLSWSKHTAILVSQTVERQEARVQGTSGAVRQSAEDLQRCDNGCSVSSIDAGAPAPAVRLPWEPSAYSARSCPFSQESGARLDLHARCLQYRTVARRPGTISGSNL